MDFWIEPGRIKSPVDMLVSPSDFPKLSRFLKRKNIQFKIQTSNVESHFEHENDRHLGTMFSTYSGFDYGRYHNLNEVTIFLIKCLHFYDFYQFSTLSSR